MQLELKLSEADRKRVDRILQQKDEFGSPEHVVRKALHQFLEHKEAELLTPTVLEGEAFSCHKRDRPEGYPVQLSFKPEKPLRLKYHQRGDPPHTAILETENTVIGGDEIEDRIEELDSVAECRVPNTTGDIRVTVNEYLNDPLDDVIEDIGGSLVRLIQERDRRIRQGEESKEEAKRRALSEYWDYYN